MAKSRKLEIFPDATGLHPLLNDFLPQRKARSNEIEFDFLNAKKIDSIGLTILMGLLFLGKDSPGDYKVNLIWSRFEDVNRIISGLDIVELLDAITLADKAEGERGVIDDLFTAPSSPHMTRALSANHNTLNTNEFQKIILFNPKAPLNRQEALNLFSRALKSHIRLDSPRTFNHEQIIKTFIELAKNTFDHSDGFGIAGLQKNINSKTFQFVYCDTGKGICQNVRNFLRESSDPSKRARAEKDGSMDILHAALQPGFTTKSGNGINHGMGLTLIAQGAMGCGFNLLLRDAESFVDLSEMEEPYTHEKLRRNFFATVSPKLLIFYFEREMKIDTAAST